MIFVMILKEPLGFTFLAVNDKHVKHRRHTEAGMHTSQHTSKVSRLRGLPISSHICLAYIGKLLS